MFIIALASAGLATLFTMWSPASVFSFQDVEDAIQAWQPVAVPTDIGAVDQSQVRVGIVAGHWGSDNGNQCADGLTEQSVNQDIASRVQQILTQANYQVDLFKEFDDTLNDYKGTVLVSIHNGSCDYIGGNASGFKVAMVAATSNPNRAARLVDCLVDRYEKETFLPFLPSEVTEHMTQYHTFNELDPATTAAVIETGYLNLDRELLTVQPDLVAQGIANGIKCYVRNESVP